MVDNHPTRPENDTLKPGTKMADGSVYAGKTAVGELMFAMPQDLDVTMTFNAAAKAVQTLNRDKALGYDDWEIPSIENLHTLRTNKNEGSLKGTFNLMAAQEPGFGWPDWYWSCTQPRGDANSVHFLRFSYSNLSWPPDAGWGHKDLCRLSCRPVRIVAPAASPK
jgi:hypothetical protein